MSSNMAEQPLGSSKLPALLGAALVSKLNFRHVMFSGLALIGASATHMYVQARSVGARSSHFSHVAKQSSLNFDLSNFHGTLGSMITCNSSGACFLRLALNCNDDNFDLSHVHGTLGS